jgi:hypothetical protein
MNGEGRVPEEGLGGVCDDMRDSWCCRFSMAHESVACGKRSNANTPRLPSVACILTTARIPNLANTTYEAAASDCFDYRGPRIEIRNSGGTLSQLVRPSSSTRSKDKRRDLPRMHSTYFAYFAVTGVATRNVSNRDGDRLTWKHN